MISERQYLRAEFTIVRRNRARFAKARSYMLRKDDLMACKNMRCRKRFEISGVQSVVFTE